MYGSFALYAGMECAIWLNKRCFPRSLQLPEALMSLADAIIMLVIGMLFTFHLQGRFPLDVRVHTLFYYVAFAAAAILLLEAFRPRDLKIVLMRIYIYLQLGVWLIAMGFIMEDW